MNTTQPSADWISAAEQLSEIEAKNDAENIDRILRDPRMFPVFDAIDSIFASRDNVDSRSLELPRHERYGILALMWKKGGRRPAKNAGEILRERKSLAAAISKLVKRLKEQDDNANGWLTAGPGASDLGPLISQLSALADKFRDETPLGRFDPVHPELRKFFPKAALAPATWLERRMIDMLTSVAGDGKVRFDLVTTIVDVAMNRKPRKESAKQFADRVDQTSSRWRTFLSKNK